MNKPVTEPNRYRAYTRRNIDTIAQFRALTPEQRGAISAVSRVLPFRVNNYVIEELIDWDDIPRDPIFQLTFPQQGMLTPGEFDCIWSLLNQGASEKRSRSGCPSDQNGIESAPGGTDGPERPSAGRRTPGGYAAQVPRNRSLLSEPRPDLPCLLYVLLPLGPVRWYGGIPVQEQRGDDTGAVPGASIPTFGMC